jgi:hypothetical protein
MTAQLIASTARKVVLAQALDFAEFKAARLIKRKTNRPRDDLIQMILSLCQLEFVVSVVKVCHRVDSLHTTCAP